MKQFWGFFICLAVFLASAAGCQTRRVEMMHILNDVELIVNDFPDSALAVLHGMDTSSLDTRALRAKYSLLNVMALDKCYEDITAHGLLEPAESWYIHHGSPDDRMKTLYYRGRIAQDSKNLTDAAVFYVQAEEYAKTARDMHAIALLYEAISSVYNSAHNTDKEQEYVEKSLRVYNQSNDPLYGSALGNLAIVYQTRHDWAAADSLFKLAISCSEDFPHSLAIYLSNYSRMKVLQQEPDPAGAIALLDRLRHISDGLTPMEAGTYAYALLLSGKEKEAKTLLEQLEHSSVSSSPEVAFWTCRIAYYLGDYKLAYESLNRSRRLEETEIRTILSDSVSEAIDSHHVKTALEQRNYHRKQFAIIVVLVLILSLALTLSSYRRQKLEEVRIRLSDICSALSTECEIRATRSSQLQEQLIHVRENLAKERKWRYHQAIELRSAMGRLDHLNLPSWFNKDSSIIAVKKELSFLYDIDDSGEKLVHRLDFELDGAVSALVQDLNLQDKPEEQLFLCCLLLDFPKDLVEDRFKLTSGNYRVKKHRFKNRISELNNPDYDILFDIRRGSLQTN